MKKKILEIAQRLGIVQKINDKTATNEDYQKFSEALKTELQLSLTQAIEHMNAVDEPAQTGASISDADRTAMETALLSIGNVLPNSQVSTPAPAQASVDPVSPTAEPVQPQASTDTQLVGKLVDGVTKLVGAVNTLSRDPENATGRQIAAKPKLVLCGPGHNDKYAFGIPHQMFAIADKRWNKAAVMGVASNDNYTKKEKQLLFEEFDTYGEQLQKRYEALHKAAQLGALKQGTIDYTSLESELGAYYQVRRQDALISHILTLPTVPFPVRYNVQDEEIIVNSFHGKSFSQSYQSGHVFAGGFKFAPAKAKVKDVMFKYKFTDLKDLEKEYIGYLNREGSDPIKWSFIEWIMARCAEILNNEKQERRVKGVRVESTDGKPAYFMYASDGVLTMLQTKALVNPSVYALDSYNQPDYTADNFVEYVRLFVNTVHKMRGRVNDLVLVMNEIYVPEFRESYWKKYHLDPNYTGAKTEVPNFTLPQIVMLPNMGANHHDLWLMPADAIEIHENKPGEFYAFYFQRDLEELIAASYGKEGVFAFDGRTYATKSQMEASKGKFTNIFMNLSAKLLAADATSWDGFDNTVAKTIANNDSTTAITDITNAVEGELYTLICGNTTNATKIVKGDKFSTITAHWTPVAVGDFIRVIYDPVGGKFYEYDRMVNGVYAKNSALVAPQYVEASI